MEGKDQTEDGSSRGLGLINTIVGNYRELFPSIRPGAVELNERMHSAVAANRAAFWRLLGRKGLERASGSYAVLRSLYFADDYSLAQNELSRIREVSSANITHLVDRLEKKGFVARMIDPRDRRVSYVQLTPEGRDFCSEVIPAVAAHFNDGHACFSDKELALFNEFLERLQQHAERLYR